jgi:hypothetical protein
VAKPQSNSHAAVSSRIEAILLHNLHRRCTCDNLRMYSTPARNALPNAPDTARFQPYPRTPFFLHKRSTLAATPTLQNSAQVSAHPRGSSPASEELNAIHPLSAGLDSLPRPKRSPSSSGTSTGITPLLAHPLDQKTTFQKSNPRSTPIPTSPVHQGWHSRCRASGLASKVTAQVQIW